jgi:hypothetical protein
MNPFVPADTNIELPEWPAAEEHAPMEQVPLEQEPTEQAPPEPMEEDAAGVAAPKAHHWPSNLYCEGVEMARFQHGDRRPFVAAFCHETNGGLIKSMPYHAPLEWTDHSSQRITELRMYVQDDSQRVKFSPRATMFAEITWRAWGRDTPPATPPDDLEGTVVVTFQGGRGTWHTGNALDFSGWAARRQPARYEVAVLSATIETSDSERAPVAFSVTADDLLEQTHDGNLLVMPATECPYLPPSAPPEKAEEEGEEEEGINLLEMPDDEEGLFLPSDTEDEHEAYTTPAAAAAAADPEAAYDGKSVNDAPARVFAFAPLIPRIDPIFASTEILKCKLVLRIRQCRTKLAPA